MNIGLIGDFLYPLLELDNNKSYDGASVSGNEFIKAIINYSNNNYYFFTFPYQYKIIKNQLEDLKKKDSNLEKIHVYSINDLEKELVNVDILHDPMFNRFNILNNIRSLVKKPIPITVIPHAMNYPDILRECFYLISNQSFNDYDCLINTSNQAKVNFKSLFEQCESDLKTNHKSNVIFKNIPLGVEVNYFKPNSKEKVKEKLNINNDQPILLYVGRLSYTSKVDLIPLINQFNQFLKEIPDCLLLIAGSDNNEYKSFLELYIKNLGLNKSVKVFSNLDQDSILELYQISDIFLALSDSLTETFGLTVLEAMATGLPILAADWNGYKEIITDGLEGFKIPTYWVDTNNDNVSKVINELHLPLGNLYISQSTIIDMVFLFKKAKDILHNQSLKSLMSKNSIKKIYDKYSWKNIIPRYEELWKELLLKAKKTPEVNLDPFLFSNNRVTFNNYPSNILLNDTHLKLSKLGLEVLRGNRKIFFYPELIGYFDIDFMLQLIELIKRKISIKNILDHFNKDENYIKRHIAWLLKYNYLKI